MKKTILIILVFVFALSSTVLAQKKLHYDGYVRSAKIYLTLTPKDYKKAAEMCEAAIREYPNKPPVEAHFILGTIYADKHLYEEMMKEFNYVSAMCDTSKIGDVKKACDKEAFREKIDTILQSKWIDQYNSSVADLKSAREKLNECGNLSVPEEKAACDSLAMQLFAKAEEGFKGSTLLLPDSSQGWVNLGLIYYLTKREAEALEMYHQAVERNPRDVALLSNVATIYFNKQQYDSAAHYFNLLLGLELEPQSRADILYNLALAMDALKEIDSAIVLLEAVVQITPESPDALYNHSAFLVRKASRYVDPLNAYRDSAETNQAKYGPKVDSLNGELKGLYRKAAAGFEEVVKLQPDNMDALNWLGQAYFILEQWQDALQNYEKVVSIQPDNEDAWCQLLLIYLKQNIPSKIKEAKKHCTRY